MILSLLTGSTPSLPKIPTPPKDPPAIVKELTTEEKIQTNFYKCNTDLQWIRADNAQCLNKTQVATEKPSQPIESSPQSNLYEPYQCTWWVKQWKPEVGNWGNASNWGYAAQADGWTVSAIPKAGSVAWSTRGYYGHVAYVLEVGSTTVVIQEGNYDYHGSTRTIEVPISEYQYIGR